MLAIKNKYAKTCVTCNCRVNANEGYAVNEEGVWNTYCEEHSPVHIRMAREPVIKKQQDIPVKSAVITARRELTADGKIFIVPWKNDTLTLEILRAMPGRQWYPIGKYWQVSTEVEDREKIVALAQRINLTLPLEWMENKKLDGLYPYQKYGVQWLNGKGRALLCDDMGLGKTIQALMSLQPKDPVLIICPANVKYNWKSEIEKWRPDFKTHICSGRESFRWPAFGEIVICNYDILPAYFSEKQWDAVNNYSANRTVLICDEAHSVKSSTSGKHKKIFNLSAKSRQVLFLTGTPLTNKAKDLLGILTALGVLKQTFGDVGNFLKLFNVPKTQYGHDWDAAQADPSVHKILGSVMLRRKREEVLPELPDIQYQTLICDDLSTSLRGLLDIKWADYFTQYPENELPPFAEFAKIRAEIAKNRIGSMMEFVEQCEEQGVPLVVFSAHREPVEALADRPGWVTITGSTLPAERQRFADEFQAGKHKGIALTIQAGGVGINLTRAWTGLFVDLDWQPGLNDQAEKRLLRIGQQNKVRIVQMVSNHPIDLHLHKVLFRKTKLIRETLDE